MIRFAVLVMPQGNLKPALNLVNPIEVLVLVMYPGLDIYIQHLTAGMT